MKHWNNGMSLLRDEMRVNAGNSDNGALHSVMSSKISSYKARLAIIQRVLTPTLIYGED